MVTPLLFLKLCYRQLFRKLPYPETPFTDQTVIVTGANVGLGLESAHHYVRLGAAKVILAVRNLEKGEAAKRSIEESEKPSGVIEVWQLDLSSYESVKQFAKRVETLPRVDVVLENAGVATRHFHITEDNESTITTNVVSTFLLALLLLPKLRESSTKFNTTPHLSVVTSEVHFFTNFPEKSSPNIFETLNNPKTAKMDGRYEVSKLLEVFYGRELATHLSESPHPASKNIIFNFPNPGLCHSELAREGSLGLEIMKFFLARTTEEGSRNFLAATVAGAESHGQYIDCCQVEEVAPLVTSQVGVETQVRVWDELNKKLEMIQPGILANI
ncbi:MAG: hypothetical protein Q9166_006527 [cf. Caloplaca sp. 2 TL-2023]